MAALRIEDYIQQLQDPGPEFRDPEDLEDDTAARLAPHTAEDDSTAPSLQPSSLRRRAAAFSDVGGKKISRKELFRDFAFSDDETESEPEADLEEEEMDKEEDVDDDDDSDNTGEEEKISDEEEEEEDEETGDDYLQSFDRVKTFSPSSPSPPYAPSSPSNSESEEDEMEMLDDDEEEVEENGHHDLQSDDDELESEEDETEEGGAEDENEDIVIQETAIDEREKAQAVVQQLDLWDRLMEARIQLQKIVSLANRLTTMSSQGQDSPRMAEAGDALLEMNCTLHNVHNSPPSPSRKRPADVDVDELALESYQSLAKARNSTLTFWDEKTRLASKKFKSFKSYQTPVVKQVEQILSDRDRLLRRTQVIRDADAPDVCEKPEEVFDDNDFYQRLLKNLIESKASEQSTMSVSASQWLEVQRLRGKKKKKKDVDTRASKGRKLRYNVHSKLVNFMAPSDRSTWSEDARSDLFKNLFKMPSHSDA